MRRSWLSPEVIQSSAMDCGPACLKSLAAGFGVDTHYGRLREACQTDVDGTSIDVLETVAADLGLDAEQIVIPLDHLLESAAEATPAIVVVNLPNGANHFVVVWRRVGPYVQLMDPAKGRHWLRAKVFLREVFVHQAQFPIEAWCEWVRGEEYLAGLRSRIGRLGLDLRSSNRLIQEALDSTEATTIALLDAAVRMCRSLVEAGGVARGREAERLIRQSMIDDAVPAAFWAMRPSVESAEVSFRGAVVLRVRGRASGPAAVPVCPELEAAVAEGDPGTIGAIGALIRKEVRHRPALLGLATLFAAFALLIQGVLLRAALEIGTALGVGSQRWAAVAAILVFLSIALALDISIARGGLKLGRNLEARFRIQFWKKIPRLTDRYFQSRLVSDMADRSHNVHQLAHIPLLAAELLRIGITLILTTGAIVWLDPASWPFALSAAVCSLVVPMFALPALQERDLRVRSHTGALARFYLDALLGIVCLRVHSAGSSLAREHEKLLVEWSRAGVALHRTSVASLGVQLTLGFGFAAWLLVSHLSSNPTGSALLLVYWVLCLPALGEQFAQLARQVPRARSLALRLMEPLGAAEESVHRGRVSGPVSGSASGPAVGARDRGIALSMSGVDVVASGHTLLQEIDLHIEPGSHVAVVGQSGAGKSSLVGLLLGWHRAASGLVHVDGEPLDADRLARLRDDTAWVDPTVQLWNRSLLENLLYGSDPGDAVSMSEILQQSDLERIAAQLPGGLSCRLGESGARLSGGEGQRVRIGRASARPNARLVVLDEAFRGLDRALRKKLLNRARQRWVSSTLLCVTHDLDHTVDFDRVLVIDGGRIVEDGNPQRLAARPGSHYACLLQAANTVRRELWVDRFNRRLTLADGVLKPASEPSVRSPARES